MDTIYLDDITGTLGEWLASTFDAEVPEEVIKLLSQAYYLAVDEDVH